MRTALIIAAVLVLALSSTVAGPARPPAVTTQDMQQWYAPKPFRERFQPNLRPTAAPPARSPNYREELFKEMLRERCTIVKCRSA